MSQIKQLHPKEGVTLLAVKVPEGDDHRTIEDNVMIGTYRTEQGWIEKHYADLPHGNWQQLGKATEIPESVWQGIMPKGKVRYKDFVGGYLFKKATDAAISMLEAHEVYSKNPYPKPAEDDYSFYTHKNVSLQEEWQQAEANTGTWVILQRIYP